jgi:hypothetical protein
LITMKDNANTMLLNRADGRPDELALIRSEPISMQWTNELRRNIGLHPSCQLLRELLSLDPSTRTVVYPFLIKGRKRTAGQSYKRNEAGGWSDAEKGLVSNAALQDFDFYRFRRREGPYREHREGFIRLLGVGSPRRSLGLYQ